MIGRFGKCLAFLVSSLAWGLSMPVHGMTCAAESASRLVFGQYDPRAPVPLDVQGSLSVHCTPNTPGEVLNLAVRLAGGGNEQAYLRNVQSGERLFIALYRDSARAIGLDPRNLFEMRVPLAAPITFTLPLYGRIPAYQNVSVGNYQAAFTVLIDY